MPILNNWRNKQLANQNFLLAQESRCLEWMRQRGDRIWFCQNVQGFFKTVILNDFATTNQFEDSTGVVMINPLISSPKQFIDYLDSRLDNRRDIYISVNRFVIPPINDLNIDYDASLEKSIDQIMDHCHLPFKRLYQPDQVDGRHFVGVHGLDVFVYENNQ